MSPNSLTVPCNITDTYKHKDSVLQTWAGPSRLEHGLAVRSLVQKTTVCITMIIILILIIIRSLIIIVIIVAGLVSSICSSKHSTINKEEPQPQPFWLSSVQHSSI